MKFEVDYKTISKVSGPLIVVESVKNASYGEIVKIRLSNGSERTGQVLESAKGYAIVQIFGETSGISTSNASVRFLGETFKMRMSEDMLGRVFDGQGRPRDIKAEINSGDRMDINGEPLNPVSRALPKDFIQTGVSAIDGLLTLVRGQKLPVFSEAGLKHNELAAQITRQAKVIGKDEEFAVVFAGIGITNDDAMFFMKDFERTGALKRSVAFINLAGDPSIERILTPRLALTAAEFLAYERGMNVLVILTDMTNYAESLRELASAREEVPGRRGYPGYMYTDLASLYERAGLVHGRKGSITQLNILTMPNGDVTHPIPDLTGYITEGQIYLSKELANKGIYPPINPLGSLSRIMNNGIGKGKTREDHRNVADQLYGSYAKAQDARNLSTIVGKEALSEIDKRYLDFGEHFEKKFINQGMHEDRGIEDTLGIGWNLLSKLPKEELNRINSAYIEKYYKG